MYWITWNRILDDGTVGIQHVYVTDNPVRFGYILQCIDRIDADYTVEIV